MKSLEAAVAYDYRSGLSLKACGRKHGLDHSQVRTILQRQNVNRRPRSVVRPFRAYAGLLHWDVNSSDIVDPEWDELAEPVTLESLGQLGYQATDCNVSGIYRGERWEPSRHGDIEAGFRIEPLSSPVSPLSGPHSGASTSIKLRTPVLAEQATQATRITPEQRRIVREQNNQNAKARRRAKKIERLYERHRQIVRELTEVLADA